MSTDAAELLPSGDAPTLERRAVRGTLLSLGNVFGQQLLRLAGNVVTTRLLFPEAYGLMVYVLIVMQGLQMISDIGIVPSIVQHERGEERSFLDTAWTIQIARGALITALALLLAWPMAQAYGHAELTALIAVASIQGAVIGLDSTKLGTLNRRLQLGRLVLVNLAGQLVTLVVMVAWAYLAPSVWALLGGAIAGDATRLVMSHLALPGPRDRLGWEREAARHIYHFGKWIFLSTLVTYLGLRFDMMALGALVDLETLGVYNIGQSLAGVPVIVTGQIVSWVLLPALSESYRGDRDGFLRKVRRARRVINAGGVLMVAGTAICAPAFFYLVYDERYHAAGWMVQLLMPATWFYFLQETSVRVQLAMGDSRAQMLANLAKLGCTAPSAIVGFLLGRVYLGSGIAGLVLGLAVGAFAGYAAVAWMLRERGLPIFLGDLRWTALGLVIALLGGYGPWALAPLVGVEAPIVSIIVGALVIVPYALWSVRLVLRELRARR